MMHLSSVLNLKSNRSGQATCSVVPYKYVNITSTTCQLGHSIVLPFSGSKICGAEAVRVRTCFHHRGRVWVGADFERQRGAVRFLMAAHRTGAALLGAVPVKCSTRSMPPDRPAAMDAATAQVWTPIATAGRETANSCSSGWDQAQ